MLARLPAHALLTRHGAMFGTVATREGTTTTATRRSGGESSTEPPRTPRSSGFMTCVYVQKSSNGRSRNEAWVLPARPSARSQDKPCRACALAHTEYPHRDPGPPRVPAVIKLNCYRSCGTSALVLPASAFFLPRHAAPSRVDLS